LFQKRRESTVTDRAQGRWRPVLYYLSTLLFSLAALAVATRFWEQRLDIAIKFGGDALWNAIPIKAMQEGQPFWNITRLSAPFHYNLLLFWQGNVIGMSLAMLMGLLIPNANTALLVAWFLKAGAAGVTCAWSLRQLKVAPPIAMGLGAVYAAIPYALGNHSDMYTLSTHIQPVFCALALLLLRGKFTEMTVRQRLPFYIGAVAAGLDDIYAAYFCCFLIAVTAGLAALQRQWPRVVHGASIIAITAMVVIANFAPAMVAQSENPGAKEWMSHQREPRPGVVIADGSTVQWGLPLQLRVMLAPVSGHIVAPLAKVTEKLEQTFGGDLFMTRRMAMGVLGAAGFIFMMLGLCMQVLQRDDTRARRWREPVAFAGVLTLACLFLGTTDSVYQIIAAFFFSLIRGYYRLLPFIQFFSFFAVGLWATVVLERHLRERKAGVYAGIAVVALLAVLDQMGTFVSTAYIRYQAASHDDVRAVVRRVEETLPAGAMVYQFPDVMRARFETHQMLSFDQLRPYLLTHDILWSYAPVLRSDPVARWHDELNALSRHDQLRALLLAGFDGIWIDRAGFEDYGNEIVSFYSIQPGVRVITEDPQSRYVFLDISELRHRLIASMGESAYQEAQARVLQSPELAE
jgi:phosphoglycerol transferase